MKNFIDFKKNFELFKIAHAQGMTIDVGKLPEAFVTDIELNLPSSKIFMIEETTKFFIAQTQVPKKNSYLELPFDSVFLDVQFTPEDFDFFGLEYGTVIGFLLRKGDLRLIGKDTKVGTNLRVSYCVSDGIAVQFNTINCAMDLDEEYKNLSVKKTHTVPKDIEDFISNFVRSFLNFLYCRDIEYVDVSLREEQNRKRIERGKVRIPSMYAIRISGTIKKYIDSLRGTGLSSLMHRFYVHGYYKTLTSPRFVNKRYKVLFVPWYIKGRTGELIEKEYEVGLG